MSFILYNVDSFKGTINPKRKWMDCVKNDMFIWFM